VTRRVEAWLKASGRLDMQQSQTTPASISTERPDCANCGMRMFLARIEPDKPDYDRRTFE